MTFTSRSYHAKSLSCDTSEAFDVYILREVAHGSDSM